MAAAEHDDSFGAAAAHEGQWRRAGFREIGRVAAALRHAEFRYVPFTSRLRAERWAQRVAPIRGAAGGWQVLVDGARLAGGARDARGNSDRDGTAASGTAGAMAVMVTATGLVLPALGHRQPLPPQFATALAATHGQVYSIMGTAEDVMLVEDAVGRPIGTSVDYLLMTLEAGDLRSPGDGGDAADASDAVDSADAEGLRFHRATPADVARLFELQRGYEIEEVLLRPARFNADNCRRHLRQALRKELVLYATRRGQPVAKAATNARGFAVDQIGGVYTLPELRSRGIGAAIMVELLRRVLGAGRSATLFVKPHNAAAIRLYQKLGFQMRGDYRIAYYFD